LSDRLLPDGVTARDITTSRLRTRILQAGPPDAPPLILVHGSVSAASFFADTMAGLAGQFRCIAPDLRGFGDSAPAPVDARRGLRDFSDDLHASPRCRGSRRSSCRPVPRMPWSRRCWRWPSARTTTQATWSPRTTGRARRGTGLAGAGRLPGPAHDRPDARPARPLPRGRRPLHRAGPALRALAALGTAVRVPLARNAVPGVTSMPCAAASKLSASPTPTT
jgi:hypothetical protein